MKIWMTITEIIKMDKIVRPKQVIYSHNFVSRERRRRRRRRKRNDDKGVSVAEIHFSKSHALLLENNGKQT
jgi:hypothetical protein